MGFTIESIACRVFRAPIEIPVRTSFGVMRDRPALLVEVRDADGVVGWGEIWCNFPQGGAEHRARLVRDVMAPLLEGQRCDDPSSLHARLDERLAVLAIQAGEPGPIAQALAGIDIALWDLTGRRAGRPVWELLGGERKRKVAAYASGLNPDQPENLAASMWAAGHRAFKLKVGFGEERDLSNLRSLRRELGSDALLMADANQAWSVETATGMARRMNEFGLQWLEEPLRADRPRHEWKQLAQASPMPLAAGENMRGDDFEAAIAVGTLGVLQPDLGKWGGFSRCVEIGRRALERGMRFCPHWLGGGIGLAASAHLLAAVGGDGMVEVDSNPNPLRQTMLDRPLAVSEGEMELPEGPGLGVAPNLGALAAFEIRH